jgi:hypothetical protein
MSRTENGRNGSRSISLIISGIFIRIPRLAIGESLRRA